MGSTLTVQFFIDTSIIAEALEHQFPPTEGFGTIHPPSLGGRSYRPMMRGFASFWTDLPFYRVSVGTVPGAVWRSSFGTDRGDLIGHPLDADKLERKIPQNLSGMDMHFSMLEPLFTVANGRVPWVFETETPSLADIALFFMLDWAEKMSRGEGMENLTGGEVPEGSSGEGIGAVFHEARYPSLWQWFANMKTYFGNLPNMETKVQGSDAEHVESVLSDLRGVTLPSPVPLLGTPSQPLISLDERNGLCQGTMVSVTPDNTGRNQPTYGHLAALTPEEIVIAPETAGGDQRQHMGDLRVHFPRVGFVVKPVQEQAVL